MVDDLMMVYVLDGSNLLFWGSSLFFTDRAGVGDGLFALLSKKIRMRIPARVA